MIKFFRNMRQSLLNDGKTSKYLRYAIGEIVLVVIGILIAIQANNWNIEKTVQKEKEFAMNKLIENLKQDIWILKTGHENANYFMASLDSCLTMLKNPNAYPKDHFDELFAIMNLTIDFEFNQYTFNELSNSGKLKLIKNEKLIDSLFRYYDVSIYKSVEDAINYHTRENIRSYTTGYDFLVFPHDIDQHMASQFAITSKTLADYGSDVRIINAIRFKIWLFLLLTERYEELIDKATNLITLINEELSQN